MTIYKCCTIPAQIEPNIPSQAFLATTAIASAKIWAPKYIARLETVAGSADREYNAGRSS